MDDLARKGLINTNMIATEWAGIHFYNTPLSCEVYSKSTYPTVGDI